MAHLTTTQGIFIGNRPIIDTVDNTDGLNGAPIYENASALIRTYNPIDGMEVRNMISWQPTSGLVADTDPTATAPDSWLPTDDYYRGGLRPNGAYQGEGWKINDSSAASPKLNIEASQYYQARVTLENGTIVNMPVHVIQFTNGDTYVRESDFNTNGLSTYQYGGQTYNHSSSQFDGLSIRSLELVGTIARPADLGLPSNLVYDNRSTFSAQIVCFTDQVSIDTVNGLVPAGALKVGDLVRTRDNGFQSIKWIDCRKISKEEMESNPKLRPISIKKDALAPGLPSEDLLVSPQHRILLSSKIAQRMFGAYEVLVAAKQLLVVDGIDIVSDLEDVTYVHFLCDEHQLVFANGIQAETLFVGAEAMKAVGEAAQEEIHSLFPAIREGHLPEPARYLTSGREARKLVMRHVQKGRYFC